MKLLLAGLPPIVGWAALWAGCSARSAWMQDESARIDESMKAEKFSRQMPGAAGTAVEAAAPIAPKSEAGYSLESLRDPKRREPKRSGKSKARRTKEDPNSPATTAPRYGAADS